MDINNATVEATSQELSIPPAKVIEALRIIRTYQKIAGQKKEQRKRDRAEANRLANLVARKAEFPDKCFCHEDGIPVIHDKLVDMVVGEWTSYNWSDYSRQHPIQNDYYQCRLCGKKWYDPGPAIA